MKKVTERLIVLLITALMTVAMSSCSESLMTNPKTRTKVEQRLAERADWVPQIPETYVGEQRQALQFLYAYMPLGDVADYDMQLYVDNVAATLKARDELTWGVPEDLFLHFVLPLRINNENLDRSRIDFYAELRDRVKGLSMADAILEVNHWCHEKVVYTPSDSRTSSPSATVRNAEGRCGEESTFTVAALRAVGIPARQVYTPRWAHTDDNHAWVEAWADGRWYYMGACEPEPVLNTGWFDAPAARGLIMHTKVFGDYPGPEEILDVTNSFTEINATQIYAPEIASATVKVLRSDGTPASGANVLFGIYNYAEFYPAVRKVADSMGVTSLSAGLGTMVIWANDGHNYGFSELRFGRDSVVVVELNRSGSYSSDIDLVPPREVAIVREISADQRAANARRLAQEDSIRTAYVSTFISETQARNIAAELGLDGDKTSRFLVESRGNHAEIESFLRANPNEMALQLLGAISRKDLHDTPASVLNDHLQGAAQYKDRPFFVEYILNPRIDTELLTPYRSRLSSIGSCGTVDQILSSVKEIRLVKDQNPANLAITPMGVNNLRMADEAALERYTIALLRSKGVAARHEPITERVQYYNADTKSWVNIAEQSALPKGKLALNYKQSGKNDDPKYDTHFTIAKLEAGEYKSIDISSSAAVDMGPGLSLSTLFSKPLPLEVGSYRLTSGSRMASGTVLSRVEFFDIEAGKQTDVELVMRRDSTAVQVIGSMNPESMYVSELGAVQSILSTTGRGYFVLALVEAKKEPTNHAMRDLMGLKKELEEWGRSVVILFRDQEQYRSFDKGEFPGLPATVVFGYDSESKTANMVKSMMQIENMNNLPIFMVADSFGRVVFFSQGYRIGMGEQMIRVIDGLKPEE